MFEWRELFIPTILERGNKILQSNISEVHITEEGIRAKVKGTEEYDLLIRTGLNEMTCTCPLQRKIILLASIWQPCLYFAKTTGLWKWQSFSRARKILHLAS